MGCSGSKITKVEAIQKRRKIRGTNLPRKTPVFRRPESSIVSYGSFGPRVGNNKVEGVRKEKKRGEVDLQGLLAKLELYQQHIKEVEDKLNELRLSQHSEDGRERDEAEGIQLKNMNKLRRESHM